MLGPPGPPPPRAARPSLPPPRVRCLSLLTLRCVAARLSSRTARGADQLRTHVADRGNREQIYGLSCTMMTTITETSLETHGGWRTSACRCAGLQNEVDERPLRTPARAAAGRRRLGAHARQHTTRKQDQGNTGKRTLLNCPLRLVHRCCARPCVARGEFVLRVAPEGGVQHGKERMQRGKMRHGWIPTH